MEFNFLNKYLKQNYHKRLIILSFILFLLVFFIVIGVIYFYKSDLKSEALSNQEKVGGQISEIENIPPKIAVVISNLGLNKEIFQEALSFPDHVSFIFTPYANNVVALIEQANNLQHDALMTLPIQPSNYQFNDPGPYALLDNLTDSDNLDRLNAVLNISKAIVGLYISDDETFTQSINDVNVIIPTLKSAKLPILFRDLDGTRQLDNLLNTNNNEIELITFNVIGKKELDISTINNELTDLENKAYLSNQVVAVIKPYPIVLNLLKKWLEKNKDSNFQFVKFSEISKMNWKKNSKKNNVDLEDNEKDDKEKKYIIP